MIIGASYLQLLGCYAIYMSDLYTVSYSWTDEEPWSSHLQLLSIGLIRNTMV